jgi:sphinganine-1-phosphate aldolase
MADEGFERLLNDFYPYRATSETYRRIPYTGRTRAQVAELMRDLAQREDEMGDLGRVSGSLYAGDHDHYRFLADVFGDFAHANVLQRDMYPSATKFEGEIIAMVADLLQGDVAKGFCGVVTSGGSESLITALYAYREQAAERGVSRPNVILPTTAHVALRKGAHWMGIETRVVPVGEDYLADVAAMAEQVDENTIALVGSAANYAHGLIDPIEAMSEVALEHGIGLHVDGCLGGLILPWIERNGHDVPPWDFRVPGVTSISADTHKYGYALKGTSVLLYRTKALRKHQYYTVSDWPGGLYLSPGLAGSRSGGLIASTWAALVTVGKEDYLEHAEQIMTTAQAIRAGIDEIPELAVIGDPLFLVAFQAAEGPEPVDIYLVNDALKQSGWRMNALQLPPALHFCVTRPNTQAGVAEDFLEALGEAVEYAVRHRGEPAESGAMYGLGGTPQGYSTMNEIMSGVLDIMQEVPPDDRGA